MPKSRVTRIFSFTVAAVTLAIMSYWYGAYLQRRTEARDLAYVQATLALAHVKSYENLESLLLRKCYDAALTVASGLKTEQVYLLYENFRDTGQDATLAEYIKGRDPGLLNAVLVGQVPAPKPYTVTC